MADEEDKTDTPKEVEDEEAEKKEEQKPSSNDMVTKAQAAAIRLEEANKVTENLVIRQEKLAVQSALGGKSEAGKTLKKEKMNDEAYANAFMEGKIRDLEDESN